MFLHHISKAFLSANKFSASYRMAFVLYSNQAVYSHARKAF